MDRIMPENGSLIKLREMGRCIMQMGMCMRGSGRMTNPMDLESISIPMGWFMKASGRMIGSMGRGLRFGPMGKNTKVNLIWESKKEREFLNLTTAHSIKVISLITKFME